MWMQEKNYKNPHHLDWGRKFIKKSTIPGVGMGWVQAPPHLLCGGYFGYLLIN
jgi:hypothetical protein